MDINELIKRNTDDILHLTNAIAKLSASNRENLMRIENQVFIIQTLQQKIERLEHIMVSNNFKDPRTKARE